MSLGTYVIKEILEEVYGGNATGYHPSKEASKGAEINFGDVQWYEKEEAERMSSLGTPLVSLWKLKGGNYNTFDLKGNVVQKALNDLEMPHASIVDFRRAKVIAKSRIGANQGTVKEVFSMGDWNIRVRGVLFETSEKSVIDQMESLLEFEVLMDSITVEGGLFSSKSISELVIENISFRQIPKRPGMLKFTMNCLSDAPNELIINL